MEECAEWLVAPYNECQTAVARWEPLWGPAYPEAQRGVPDDTITELESVCATAEAPLEKATKSPLVRTPHWDLQSNVVERVTHFGAAVDLGTDAIRDSNQGDREGFHEKWTGPCNS